MTSATSTTETTGVFLGRVTEMKALHGLLDEAHGGLGRLVLVTGEPGIGKTRLAEELARHATTKGWRTAWGRTWEGAGTPAFWPWTQLLRRLAGMPDLKAAFAGAALGPLLDPVPAVEEHGDTEHRRFVMFDCTAQVLVRASSVHPLLLVLDDLHAADFGTLALLKFVARVMHEGRMLIVATSRNSSHGLEDVQREARHLPLQRLTRDEVVEWIARSAPHAKVDDVWAASEGNPLFVEELLAGSWTRGQLPVGVRHAVRAHLAQLSPMASKLLETASVLGRELAFRTLKALASAEEISALDEALSARVLRDLGDGRLEFSHVLLQEELYARLADERRGALHRSAASGTRNPTLVAHHALRGFRPENAAATHACIREAMREAAARLAHEDAARFGRDALEILSGHLAPQDECELVVSIAEALVLAGALRAAMATAERAASMAADLGLGTLLARAALARATEIAFGRDEPVIQWLQKSLAMVGEGDSRLRAEVMARLAAALNNSPGDREEMVRMREAAIAMARRLRDEKALFTALHSASGMYPEELQPRERFALFSETIEVADRTGTIGRVIPILAWHVVSWLELGEPEGALRAADRVEKLLESFTQPEYRWQLPLVRAVLASVAGRFDEAYRLAEESVAISQRHRIREGLMMYCVYRSGLPYLRGDDGGVGEVMPLVEEVMSTQPMLALFRSIWEAPLGRVERVRDALSLLQTTPARNVTGAAMLGWPCTRAGVAEHAELLFDLAATIPAHNPLSFGPGGFACLGPTSLMIGRLAVLCGRREEAKRCFEKSLRIARELRSPPSIAQVELSWAELHATGDRDACVEHARAALENASAVGMTAVAERAAQLLQGAQRSSMRSTDRAIALRRDGELWVLEAMGRRMTLRDSKGLFYLEALLSAPHRPLHVLELVGMNADSDAGPELDEEAKRAYRERIQALRVDLEEASAQHDPGRAERARRELELLETEIARAFGLGGRQRRSGSAAERARINVQRRLRDVLRRISEEDQFVGRQLELSLRTGVFCMYAPTWPD